jgi:hypothetical protein
VRGIAGEQFTEIIDSHVLPRKVVGLDLDDEARAAGAEQLPRSQERFDLCALDIELDDVWGG